MAPECLEKFSVDPIYEGAILHYLYLISDSSISVAEMVLKTKNIAVAQYYSETIDLLGEHDVLPRAFAYEFSRIASFRNFLAHDYEDVDAKVICEQTLEKLEDVELYLTYIEKAIN